MHGWDLGVGHHLNFKIRKTGVRKGVFSVFFIMVLIQVTSFRQKKKIKLPLRVQVFFYNVLSIYFLSKPTICDIFFLILIKVLQNLDVGMHGHLKIK